MSAELTHSGGASGSGSSARRSDGGAANQRMRRNTCAFWLGEHCYGLDIALVGEVVEVDALAPVPLAPAAVIGLFNLRGTPVALIDPARLLDLPEPPLNDEPRPGRPLTALVLRTEAVLIGLLIRRMEMVITAGKGIFSAAEASDAEHPVVAGFLELAERGLTITVLDADAVLGHIERLKYSDGGAG
ncbi:MAG TPA: chemotaxis protein CheW [Polyangia bacterium]|nr:chemotaxis protein CheW [Polyangia bacterium]